MNNPNKIKKIILTLAFICLLLILFRPFVAGQIQKRGDGYLSYNMYQDAIRQYKKAIILNPEDSRTMTWLGYAYKSRGDIQDAIQAYEKSLEIDSQNILACHGLGLIYASNKKFERAKTYFSKASAVGYNDERLTNEQYIFYHYTSLDMLAFCQEKLGEIDAALATYNKILTDYPESGSIREKIESKIRRLR